MKTFIKVLATAALVFVVGYLLYRQQQPRFEPGANLENRSFKDLDLSGRDLRHANFRGAVLERVNLRGAQLDSANFTHARLLAVDLTEASLQAVVLDSTRLYDVAGLDDERLVQTLGLDLRTLPVVLTRKRIRLERKDEILKHLQPVAEGKGVKVAAPYGPRGRFRPIMLLDSQGQRHRFMSRLPENWQPAALRFCQLVACIAEDEVLLQRCPYSYSRQDSYIVKHISRYRHRTRVTLRSAKTGKVMARRTFHGSRPANCPPTSTSRYDESYYGDSVSFEDIKPWLEKYVNPPEDSQKMLTNALNN